MADTILELDKIKISMSIDISPVKDVTKTTVEIVEAEIGLSDVAPVHIDIDNLSIECGHQGGATSGVSRLYNRLRRQPNSNVHEQPAKQTVISLLKNVNAHIPAGTLTAIIGSSGCGKTTLLNQIAERSSASQLQSRGTVKFNGQPGNSSISMGYVMQQDALLDVLTVRETLRYAADLRLSTTISKDAKNVLVDNIIRDLDIVACADNRIGDETHKGCSGGEKRRVSIGVQMLANPSVLFCDEPTTGEIFTSTMRRSMLMFTGLDAHSAFQTMKVLKSLATNGRTVITSIHSPRSEIWAMFDNVILLSAGEVLYSGETTKVATYFAAHGYDMPATTNPAEFLIDLAAIDQRSEAAQRTSQERVDALKKAWIASEQSPLLSKESAIVEDIEIEESSRNSLGQGLASQIITLTKRSSLQKFRDPFGILATILEAIVVGVAIGWIYHRPGNDLSGIRTRQGAVFTAATVQPYLIMLVELHRLFKDIQIYDREKTEHAVSAWGFLISRRLASLLEDLLVPTIFATIFYFVVGLRADPATFFVFLATNVILHFVALGMVNMCVAISRDSTTAAAICNLSFNVQVLASGYFVQSAQLPIWLRWIKYIVSPSCMLMRTTYLSLIVIDVHMVFHGSSHV